MVLPADYFVIDMEETSSPKSLPLILGRPFMATAHTNINVYKGTLTMEVLGERVTFQVFEHNDINKGMLGHEDKELREEVKFFRAWKAPKVKKEHSIKNLNEESKDDPPRSSKHSYRKAMARLFDKASRGAFG